jgi:hypothetical protein
MAKRKDIQQLIAMEKNIKGKQMKISPDTSHLDRKAERSMNQTTVLLRQQEFPLEMQAK